MIRIEGQFKSKEYITYNKIDISGNINIKDFTIYSLLDYLSDIDIIFRAIIEKENDCV